MEDETRGHRREFGKGYRNEGKRGTLKAKNWFRLAAELDERFRTETTPAFDSVAPRRFVTLTRYVE
jgi:hypothetical protein